MTSGASAIATSDAASAHTPEVAATCSTLSVSLSNYSGDRNPNRIAVSVDSASVEKSSFGATFAKSYPLGDSTVAHGYVVTVDAPGTAYDRTFEGTSVPCPAPMKKDASATLAVTPADCDASGTLVLGDAKNAAWGKPSATTGPASYTVTATAVSGHAFPDGKRSKTFSGAIDGRLDPTVAPCASLVVVPDRPVPSVVVSDETARDCDSLTQTTTTTTTTTDWVLDEPTNSWVKTPAVTTTSSATVPVAVTECPTVEVPPTVSEVPPTPPTTTPPTTTTPPKPSVPTDVTRTAVPDETLASTGSNAGVIAPIGVALLLAGVLLALGRGLRVGRAPRS